MEMQGRQVKSTGGKGLTGAGAWWVVNSRTRRTPPRVAGSSQETVPGCAQAPALGR